MRYFLFSFLFVGVLSWTSAVHAQPDRLLPAYTECSVEGIRYACYSASQQLQLNLLEENARTWRAQLELSEQLRIDQARLIINLGEQITDYALLIASERRRIEALTTQLLSEIEEKNRYRAEASNIDWWPLLVGGIVGLIGAGVAIGVGVAASTGALSDTD